MAHHAPLDTVYQLMAHHAPLDTVYQLMAHHAPLDTVYQLMAHHAPLDTVCQLMALSAPPPRWRALVVLRSHEIQVPQKKPSISIPVPVRGGERRRAFTLRLRRRDARDWVVPTL
jgi:hypothetical protein